MAPQPPIALTDWQEQMAQHGKLHARFACPACGHAASPVDFAAAGADPQRAPRECIGRLGTDHPGCDWAAFGLFDICPVHVELPDGEVLAVFGFADAP